jgi:hypothetical protein
MGIATVLFKAAITRAVANKRPSVPSWQFKGSKGGRGRKEREKKKEDYTHVRHWSRVSLWVHARHFREWPFRAFASATLMTRHEFCENLPASSHGAARNALLIIRESISRKLIKL